MCAVIMKICMYAFFFAESIAASLHTTQPQNVVARSPFFSQAFPGLAHLHKACFGHRPH